MPDVNRIGFTELTRSEDVTDPTPDIKRVKYGRLEGFKKGYANSKQYHLHTWAERTSLQDVGEQPAGR